jgi:hypothetical protein
MKVPFLILLLFILGCESPPIPKQQSEVHKHPPASRISEVSLGIGSIELPPSCVATIPEFYIDAYSGNIMCPADDLEFEYEGGFTMPMVQNADRRAWQHFYREQLPDGNKFVYGVSRVKDKTHCYVSICPNGVEFGCGSFVLITSNDTDIAKFLTIVRTFKLKPLYEPTQSQTNADSNAELPAAAGPSFAP